MNIYVGNLPYDASEEEVRTEFEAYGEVKSVALIKDKMTGQARGFGFVEMPNDEEAQNAITALNGKQLRRRPMIVNQARPKENREFRGGDGGSGGERRYNNSGGGGDRSYQNRQGGDRRRSSY